MRISRTNRSGRPQAKQATRQPASGGAAFSVSGGTSPAEGPRSATTGPLAAVDALLALQGVGDATDGRKRAVRRGEEMLDILEDMRIDLLGGHFKSSRLQRLLGIVNTHRADPCDAALSDLLDEIELRARVELAKFGKIAA